MKTILTILRILSFIMICLLSNQVAYAQIKAPECGARIDIKVEGSVITVTGYYKNITSNAASYTYELLVTKSGGANHSSNKQSGIISVQPGVETSLSTVKINISDSDMLELELRIIHNGDVICTQKEHFPPSSKKP